MAPRTKDSGSDNSNPSLTQRLLQGIFHKSWKNKKHRINKPLRVLHILSQQPGKTGSGVYL